ncbi:hypothetical protein RV10_GL001865 [Enterococcus pallens]|nr:hypothetical protein RV10_GL001865 [Enterococcus pallens]
MQQKNAALFVLKRIPLSLHQLYENLHTAPLVNPRYSLNAASTYLVKLRIGIPHFLYYHYNKKTITGQNNKWHGKEAINLMEKKEKVSWEKLQINLNIERQKGFIKSILNL